MAFLDTSQPANQAVPASKPSVLGRVNLANETIPLPTLMLLPQETAGRYRTIVFRSTIDKKTKQRTLYLAALDPTSEAVQKLVEFLQEHNHTQVMLYEAAQEEIDAQL